MSNSGLASGNAEHASSGKVIRCAAPSRRSRTSKPGQAVLAQGEDDVVAEAVDSLEHDALAVGDDLLPSSRDPGSPPAPAPGGSSSPASFVRR